MAGSKEKQPCTIAAGPDGLYKLLASDGTTLVNLGKNAECQTLEGALRFWDKKLAALSQEVERTESARSYIAREDKRPERDEAAQVVQALRRCLQRQLGSSIK